MLITKPGNKMVNDIQSQASEEAIADQALKMAIAGADPETIKKKLSTQAPPELINKGIAHCLRFFRDAANFNPTEERGKAYARLNLLFLSSMKLQDYKTALAAQKEINKLINLYDGEGDNPRTIAGDAILAEYDE